MKYKTMPIVEANEMENIDTWDFEFVVECIDETGKVIHTYTSVEADTEEDAKAVAEEFCRDDFPDCAFAKAIIKEVTEIIESC
jgi:hypothetical protein